MAVTLRSRPADYRLELTLPAGKRTDDVLRVLRRCGAERYALRRRMCAYARAGSRASCSSGSGKKSGAASIPDFAQIARYAWLAGDRRLQEIGIKTYQQRGEGTDFKQLTEYRYGDPVRHIDWKATLRLGKPIVREFQDERDQCVTAADRLRPAHACRRARPGASARLTSTRF